MIGWCADDTLDQSLPLRALEQALRLRQPAPGLVHHSDRGVQYASAAYQAVLAAHGIIPSEARRLLGRRLESFFATLKTEMRPELWWTRTEAKHHLKGFIDTWYNCQRRHGTLGCSPYHYERRLAQLRVA